MKVEIFVLCDAATDSQGKLNILGTFDQLFTPETPVVHPACAIAVRMRFDKMEEGTHHIRVELVDSDGNLVFQPMEGDVQARMAPDIDSVAVNLIINLQRLKLDRFGDYQATLMVDDEAVATVPLRVRRMPGRGGRR